MPTVETQIVGVVEKPSGWTSIEIDAPPRKLDTKREELVEEARALLRSGEVVLVEYSERDGRNTNPNTGQPYKDRYYEGARTRNGQHSEPEQREPERREPERREPVRESVGYGYRTHPENAWRMALTSGSERAVQTLPLMPAEQRTFEVQKQIALAWAMWIMTTPQTTTRAFEDEPAPYDAEDIPF